jgi:hypothetical protein
MKKSDKNRPLSRIEKARLHRAQVEADARAEVSRRRQLQQQQQNTSAAKETLSRRDIPRVEKRDDYWRLQTRQTRVTDYEDDFDDAYWIEGDDVLCLLRSIEQHQQALRSASQMLQRYVEDSPGFAKTWREWNAAGGVTADDFERFLDDRMRHRPTKRKRHLRLIANNKPRPLLHKSGGDDAA